MTFIQPHKTVINCRIYN